MVRDQLEAVFGADAVAEKTLPDGKAAFKIVKVPLPPGCKPEVVGVLLVINSLSEAPAMYVKEMITLRNGVIPRSVTPVQVDGETWIQFSANFPYNPVHPLSAYVFGRLGRFVRQD
jgi:hypothetical protein